MNDTRMRKFILVVEDEQSIRDLVLFIMRRHDDWAFIPATDGEEALEHYEKSRDISLILMDIVLPGVDGITVTKRIREMEARAGKAPVPILAFSGKVDSETKRQCRSSGMNDFIEKPMSLDRIEDAIRKHLSEG